MTEAQIRALRLVAGGKCQRYYSADGNQMHGAHSATLRKLESAGLIRNGRKAGNWAMLELTDKGRALLAAQPKE